MFEKTYIMKMDCDILFLIFFVQRFGNYSHVSQKLQSIIYLNAGFTISPRLSFFNVIFLHVKRKIFFTFKLYRILQRLRFFLFSSLNSVIIQPSLN